MYKCKIFAVVLAVISIMTVNSTVYADEDEEQYDDSWNYSEDYENDEYEEDNTYDDDWEYDEYTDNEDEYSDEVYDESSDTQEYSEEVSEVFEQSVEESSQPIIRNDPLQWQKGIDTIIPADVSISQPSGTSADTVSAVSDSSQSNDISSPREEKVLNIAELAKTQERTDTTTIGIMLWILIGLMVILILTVFVYTKDIKTVHRRHGYMNAKKITRKHLK